MINILCASTCSINCKLINFFTTMIMTMMMTMTTIRMMKMTTNYDVLCNNVYVT